VDLGDFLKDRRKSVAVSSCGGAEHAVDLSPSAQPADSAARTTA
jgi:hypothetical protein